MAFAPDTLEITIAEGEEIAVTFTNTSQTQNHTWLLFNHNDMDKAGEFYDAIIQSLESGEDPENAEELIEMVVAYTSSLAPGDQESVTFAAPPAGDYLYICAEPGHFPADDYGVLSVMAP